MRGYASRLAVAVGGLCLLVPACTPLQPPQPSIPAEAIFLARNNAGVAAGWRMVAISARDGTDAAELGRYIYLLTRVDAHGAITEGYLVGQAGSPSDPGVVRFQLDNRLTTQAITEDSIQGGALVDAPGLGAVLVVKDQDRCEIDGYHQGTVLWRHSVVEECQRAQEQVGQRGNLAISIEHSTTPTGLVDPATGNWTALSYPAAGCELIGDVGGKPLFACVPQGVTGGAAGASYTLRFEGGEPITDPRFGPYFPIELKAPNRPESVLWTRGLFFVLDAAGRVLKTGIPPAVAQLTYLGRPLLSPDLASIYYPTKNGVLVQSLSTGATSKVAESKAQSLALSRDGKFLYALSSKSLDVIYLLSGHTLASYPQDARDILLVATAPSLPLGPKWKPAPSDVPLPTPTPSPPPVASPVNLPAGCRLPIDKYGQVEGSVQGFLNVCNGSFAPDPNSKGGLAYSVSTGRWVPALVGQLSPDGRRYVYEQLIWRPDPASYDPRGTPDHGELHLVEIATASDRVVATVPLSQPYVIVKFTDSGVFLTQSCPSGCPEEYGRLWVMDPTSGKITKVSDIRGYRWSIDGHYAWTIADQSQDSSAASIPRHTAPPRALFRLDLSTGQSVRWLDVSCCSVGLAGLDSTGAPLLTMRTSNNIDSPVELVRVTSPNRYHFVAMFAWSDPGLNTVVTNPEGTWFYDGGYLYLYAPPASPHAVVATGGYIYTVRGELGP